MNAHWVDSSENVGKRWKVVLVMMMINIITILIIIIIQYIIYYSIDRGARIVSTEQVT